jgi:hypothetical protein
MRGAFLNCRLAVNGIQNALRSFGVTFWRFDKSTTPQGKSGLLSACAIFLYDNANLCYQFLTIWKNLSTPALAIKVKIATFEMIMRNIGNE